MDKKQIKPRVRECFCVIAASLALSGSLLAASVDQAEQGARFSHVFSEHMVLQRQQPIRVWGQASPNTELAVSMAGSTEIVRAGSDGNWQAELPSMEAGGPFELTLQSEEGLHQSLGDVLIGDVWLCSGQSNMEFTAGELNQHRSASLHSPSTIRLLTIEKDSDVLPRSDFPEAPGWAVAEFGSIHDFSAVCYRLAYELQQSHDVPFGMINASWGGSGIKSWIGAQELARTGNYDQQLAWLKTYASDKAKASQQFGQAWETWWAKRDVAEKNPAGVEPWKEPSDTVASWQAVPEAMGDWRMFADPSMGNHLGMVWYRKLFELDAGQSQQNAVLAIGGIDEVDYLWVNGQFVGTTFGWGNERFYKLSANVLNEGSNTITVNVLNTWDAGGMVGPKDHMQLKFADESMLALGDDWMYRKVSAEMGSPLRSPWESIGGLSGLSNAMIAPLEGLNLTGAIWYQGETDAGNPAPYAQLLAALTADWRTRFGESLPVLVVQLPNFGPLPVAPVESGWAAIRDAQRRVAIAEANTGLVVTVDLGDKSDLHPPDKRGVGKRAADVANVLVYGEQGIADGISPSFAHQRNDSVLIEFEPAGENLIVLSAASPIAFELCGDEAESCVFTNARIKDNYVVLDATGFGRVTHVRHCWADAPVCNLYGASGIPVSSFDISISEWR